MFNSSISILDEPEVALKIYDKIFTSREGYEISFTSHIKGKGILAPAFFTLGSEYANAFLEAAKRTGNEEFYISTTERSVPGPNDWRASLDEVSVQEYVNYDGIYQDVNNAIYSANGDWGIWFSNDLFALIGGSTEFIDTFYKVLGKSVDEMVLTFIRSMQNTTYVLEKYLPLIFGKEHAERFRRLYKSG